MKKVTLLLLFVMTAFTVSTFAQTKKKVSKKVVSMAYDKSRAEDPNIKAGVPTEDKRETKSRGASTCSIYFDNYSGLYVDVYVDGYYKGTLSPYGSFTVYVYSGYTTIYCKSTGGTRYWQDSGTCDGSYNFKLYYN